jgi:hypothetical protein
MVIPLALTDEQMHFLLDVAKAPGVSAQGGRQIARLPDADVLIKHGGLTCLPFAKKRNH